MHIEEEKEIGGIVKTFGTSRFMKAGSSAQHKIRKGEKEKRKNIE